MQTPHTPVHRPACLQRAFAFARMAIGALTLAAGLAHAENEVRELKSLALPVGHSSTVQFPEQVTKVRVEKSHLADVKKSGTRLTFKGQKSGYSDVLVDTAHQSYRFRIYVAEDKFAMP